MEWLWEWGDVDGKWTAEAPGIAAIGWNRTFELTPLLVQKGNLLLKMLPLKIHHTTKEMIAAARFIPLKNSEEQVFHFGSILTPKSQIYSTRNKFHWKIFFA